MLSVSLGARAELVLQNGESDAQIELWLGKGVLEKDLFSEGSNHWGQVTVINAIDQPEVQ